MKSYKVRLRDSINEFTMIVTLFARDTASAREEATAANPGMEFVSVVLQEEAASV